MKAKENINYAELIEHSKKMHEMNGYKQRDENGNEISPLELSKAKKRKSR